MFRKVVVDLLNFCGGAYYPTPGDSCSKVEEKMHYERENTKFFILKQSLYK